MLTDLSPTKGITRDEFDVLGYPIVKWDVGGQENFRNAALKNDRFSSTDLLFYVVDVQDQNRYDESFQYLSEILQYFRDSNEDFPHLVVCLHKVDPDLVKDSETLAKIKTCESKLSELIDFPHQTFITTIYNNWTLRKAFSKGLLKLSPKSTLLDSIMEDFLEITKSDTLLLLDRDALIFSESFRDEDNYQLSNLIAPHLATMADKLMKYGKDIQVFQGKIRGWIYFKPVDIGEKKFYIVIFNKFAESLDEIDFALPELAEKMANTLQAFFL